MRETAYAKKSGGYPPAPTAHTQCGWLGMKRTLAYALALASVFPAACSHSRETAKPGFTMPDIIIDSQHRASARTRMALLPLEYDLEDGGKPDNASQPGPIYVVKNAGNEYVAPDQIRSWKTTGPYHRVISKAGYSYLRASIFLPCKSAYFEKPGHQAGFVYVGGWGSGSGPNGTAVDAGFQYSGLRPDDAYNPMIAVAGHKGWTTQDVSVFCGQAVDLEFYVPRDNWVRLVVRGNTTRRKDDMIVIDAGANGWLKSGGSTRNGDVLKRMTTIGFDKAADPTSLFRPTYFGRDKSGRKPLVHWYAVKIGHSQNDATPWTLEQSFVPKDPLALNFPDTKHVVSTCGECDDAYDMIDLSYTKS